MAINKTGDLYKAFTFDGISSRDYGVYISGDGVFDAPERDVEMIEIPGRNGAYALDNGRFKNTEITYPAGMFGDTEADFRKGISALRNALCSRTGYCRLEDEYNPEEYRMAVYKSGLEVTPAQLKAGEFNITFEAMPQRFLKSGETAITVPSGGTTTNPTLFESSPLLIVDGNGTIDLAGNNIVVSRTPYGLLKLYGISGDSEEWSSDTDITWDFDGSLYNSGDPITINRRSNWMGTFSLCCAVHLPPSTARKYSLNSGTSTHAGIITGVGSFMPSQRTTKDLLILAGQEMNFVAGTQEEVNGTATIDVIYEDNDTENTATVIVSVAVAYDGNNSITVTTTATASPSLGAITYHRYLGEITVVSSKYSGDSLYIDLDLGEAYTYEGTEIISLNNSVSLPADLPTLKAGANTVTFDNTISSLQIVPRWWEV